MIFKQFHLRDLGHASYLLGSEHTGQALVLDVRRDVNVYNEFARDHGLHIGYDLPLGWLAGGMKAWRVWGQDLDFLPQWTADELKGQMERDPDLAVLDVRQPAEWNSGHIPGRHAYLRRRIARAHRRGAHEPAHRGALRQRLPILGGGQPAQGEGHRRVFKCPARVPGLEGARLPSRTRK